MSEETDVQDNHDEIVVAEKRALALSLAKTGIPYEAIAKEIAKRYGSCSKTRAWQYVQESLREIVAEEVEDLRRLDGERLNTLFEKTYTALLNKPKPEWVMAAVKVLERRARLFGLDAPLKHELGGQVEVKHDDPLADRVLSDRAVAERYFDLLELAKASLLVARGARDAGDGGGVGIPPAPPPPLPDAP